MELEDLKTIWQDQSDTWRRQQTGEQRAGLQQAGRQQITQQIRSLLRKRSQGLVAKMKRNLLGELLLVLLIYVPAILFYLFKFGERDPETGWALFLLLICFIGYYYRKNKLLGTMQRPDAAVHANLLRQLTSLRKYIRIYTISGTALVPVMAVISFLSGSRLFSHPSTGWIPWYLTGPDRWTGIGICVLVLAAITFLSWRANIRGMNRLYGQHIKKLKKLLEEMDGESRESVN